MNRAKENIRRFVKLVVPWAFHLAGLSSAQWRRRNAAIDGLSLLMTVTRVPLYRAVRQVPKLVV